MLNTRIILSATWVVVTLIYLYGDVLRIYYGGDRAKALAGFDVDADPDGFPDPGIAAVCESLGEYHRSRLLFPVQPGWPAHLSTVI